MVGFRFGAAQAERATRIETLTIAEVDRVRLSFWSRFDQETLTEAIRSYPGRSVWMPDTSEYAIARPWRHRPEIAAIAELSAVRHPGELVAAVERNAAELGASLVLMVEVEESRRPAFYQRIGFDLLEEVVTYELARIPDLRRNGRLKFELADVGRPSYLAELKSIDHASFPWVWWNEPDEFLEYSEAPGVEMFIGRLDGRAVAYLGFTAYLGWGHIDRVAVLPELQGQGLGTEGVRFALRRLATSGAKRIGLSTQRDNIASQRVYERLGFRRAVASDYRVYGKVLSNPPGVERMFSTR